MRELFYDRNPGDARVKVGSERKVAPSPSRPNSGVDEIGTVMIWNISAGPLQNWPCYSGIYSHKFPYTTVGFSVEIVQKCCTVCTCMQFSADSTALLPLRAAKVLYCLHFEAVFCRQYSTFVVRSGRSAVLSAENGMHAQTVQHFCYPKMQKS